MDPWQEVKDAAEELAKQSQEISNEAAKLLQEHAEGAAMFSQGFVTETTKKSKEIVAVADFVRWKALQAADRMKTLAAGIPIPIPAALGRQSSAAAAPDPGSDLESFAITEELREFVHGIQLSTFIDFPMQDEPETSEFPMVSNVRQDLNEWQAKHAMLVLSTVKEISKFRYELCPRYMEERKFWRIYFILVEKYVAPYEKKYMEELKKKAEMKQVDSSVRENPSGVPATTADTKETKLQKNSSSKTAEDLNMFLLGDLGSDGEGIDYGDDFLDDLLDAIINLSGLDSE